jgi:hypothetical protein
VDRPLLAHARPQISYKFWAGLGHPGQTLADLVAVLERAGNAVLEIDEENQRVLCARWDETLDRWGCMLCLDRGSITLLDSESEYRHHLEQVHEWRADAEAP